MAVFLSVLQYPAVETELLLRGPGAGTAVAAATRTTGLTVKSDDDETDVVLAALAPTRWFGRLFAMLGWTLILIGAAGSLVIMRAWLVTLLPELGLRAAVGATRLRLLTMVLSRLALAIGIALAFATWVAPGVRLMLSQIVGSDVGSTDGPLLSYSAILALGALLGLLEPLRRAARTVPAGLLEHTAE
jgi:hypothetical protein